MEKFSAYAALNQTAKDKVVRKIAESPDAYDTAYKVEKALQSAHRRQKVSWSVVACSAPTRPASCCRRAAARLKLRAT